jgi:hypothetical protein
LNTTFGSKRDLARTALSILVLLSLGRAAMAAPPVERLKALLGDPTALHYSSIPVSLPDGSWIKTDVEVEAVFPGKVEDLAAILLDNENFPKIFSRVESVRRLSVSGDTTISRQRNVVRLLGFSYVTESVFRTVISRPEPGRFMMVFTFVEGDGSTKSGEGSWDLEAVSVDGSPAVYVHYRNTVTVLQKFPMQLEIMQAFGKGDFERLVTELGKAFAARNGVPKPESASAPSQPHS